MKCPHCNYTNGWDAESMTSINGGKGEFYSLSNNISLERSCGFEKTKKDLYGCPSCNKVFME